MGSNSVKSVFEGIHLNGDKYFFPIIICLAKRIVNRQFNNGGWVDGGAIVPEIIIAEIETNAPSKPEFSSETINLRIGTLKPIQIIIRFRH